MAQYCLDQLIKMVGSCTALSELATSSHGPPVSLWRAPHPHPPPGGAGLCPQPLGAGHKSIGGPRGEGIREVITVAAAKAGSSTPCMTAHAMRCTQTRLRGAGGAPAGAGSAPAAAAAPSAIQQQAPAAEFGSGAANGQLIASYDAELSMSAVLAAAAALGDEVCASGGSVCGCIAGADC